VRLKADAFLKRLNAATSIEKWKNWWEKENNIEQLAKLMGLSPMYDLLYRPLCWFVHSAPVGNAYYLREDDGLIAFESRPGAPAAKDKAFAEGLLLAVPVGLLELLAVTDTVFELERQAEFNQIKVRLDDFYKGF
jgi:hypothetical protein